MDYTEIDNVIANTPGAYLDADYFQEIKSNFKEQPIIIDGDNTFNGTDGREITITNADENDYKVLITPKANPDGHFWVEIDSSTQFTVYNSNAGADTAFDWVVLLEQGE